MRLLYQISNHLGQYIILLSIGHGQNIIVSVFADNFSLNPSIHKKMACTGKNKKLFIGTVIWKNSCTFLYLNIKKDNYKLSNFANIKTIYVW